MLTDTESNFRNGSFYPHYLYFNLIFKKLSQVNILQRAYAATIVKCVK